MCVFVGAFFLPFVAVTFTQRAKPRTREKEPDSKEVLVGLAPAKRRCATGERKRCG